MPKTKDAVKIIDRMIGRDGELRDMVAEETVNAEVARMIYDARARAGLSQKALADLIGSKQPTIARLENADYEGHSLSVLQRIATALGQRLELRFVPQNGERQRAASAPPKNQETSSD